MKYTLVYRVDPQGYHWTVRNVHNQYAAHQGDGGKVNIRSWRTAEAATYYMDVCRQYNHPQDLVWAPWPTDKPAAIKRVTTAASYKPAHGGRPGLNNKELDLRGTQTGRLRSADCHITEHTKPLVWPVLPQHDDGSNEEATTVPDSLVQLIAQRVLVRLRDALTN